MKYWFKNVWLAICGGYTTPKLTKAERAAWDKYAIDPHSPIQPEPQMGLKY